MVCGIDAQLVNCPSVPGLLARSKKPLIQNTHCSAFIRVTPDLQELYAGSDLPRAWTNEKADSCF